LGTLADNMRDAASKGRMQSGENHYYRRHPEAIRRGVNNPRAKLSESDIAEIRKLYVDGWRKLDIADKFGIKPGHCSGIITRKIWKHIA